MTKSQKVNPYKIIWYNSKMTDKQVAENNTKYLEFEIKHNNFSLP